MAAPKPCCPKQPLKKGERVFVHRNLNASPTAGPDKAARNAVSWSVKARPGASCGGYSAPATNYVGVASRKAAAAKGYRDKAGASCSVCPGVQDAKTLLLKDVKACVSTSGFKGDWKRGRAAERGEGSGSSRSVHSGILGVIESSSNRKTRPKAAVGLAYNPPGVKFFRDKRLAKPCFWLKGDKRERPIENIGKLWVDHEGMWTLPKHVTFQSGACETPSDLKGIPGPSQSPLLWAGGAALALLLLKARDA